jgi:hypothetical protein
MNIVPSYPNLVPLALQPATEAARRDNQQRELVPAMRQGEAYAKESQVGSEKDKARSNESRPVTYQPDASSRSNLTQNAVSGAADQDKGKQQGQNKDQTGEGRSDDDKKSASQTRAEEAAKEALKKRDTEVRAHEQAHQITGGQYASAPTFTMTKGPDGDQYATGGAVQIDISPEQDPGATISKMQQVRAAALAPAQPSSQDRAVAAKAAQLEQQAQAQLQKARGHDGTDGQQQKTESPTQVSADVVNRYSNESLTDLMSRRNKVISNRYAEASRPAPQSQFSSYG